MSGLRCWPGCLAVVVRAANPRNVGKLVRCVRLVEPRSNLEAFLFRDFDSGAVWEVDPPLIHNTGLVSPLISDHKLTPITPPPGADCTTHEADKPQPVEA